MEVQNNPNSQSGGESAGAAQGPSTAATTLPPLPREASGVAHAEYCRQLDAYMAAILNGMKQAKSRS